MRTSCLVVLFRDLLQCGLAGRQAIGAKSMMGKVSSSDRPALLTARQTGASLQHVRGRRPAAAPGIPASRLSIGGADLQVPLSERFDRDSSHRPSSKTLSGDNAPVKIGLELLQRKGGKGTKTKVAGAR